VKFYMDADPRHVVLYILCDLLHSLVNDYAFSGQAFHKVNPTEIMTFLI
jgi:hypothetical protein